MKNKVQVKKAIILAAIVFVLYLLIYYWAGISRVLGLVVKASVPILIGCMIAYVINLLMCWYEKHYVRVFRKPFWDKAKRAICLILSLVSFAVILFFVVYLVIPEFINCVVYFISLIPEVVEEVVLFIKENELMDKIPTLQATLEKLNSENIMGTIEQFLNEYKGSIGGAVDSIVTAVTNFITSVVGIVVGAIFAIYLLYSKETIGGQCKRVLRTYFPKRNEKIRYVISVFNDSFRSFIVGQCVDAVLLGVLCLIGMLILRLPYAMMISIFVGLTAFIPIAGAYLGGIVGAVMILTESPMKALIFIIFILVLQQLEGNLIYPKVVGKSIGLPSIWVLAAVTVGAGVWGIPGMIVAVPLFSAVYRLVKEDVNKRKERKQASEQKKNNEEKLTEPVVEEEQVNLGENEA
ncbi:MAG: AI-2E family transporter [Agathobacter sp.]|nr:AI-2E family transporter [Agathobacter sp.]